MNDNGLMKECADYFRSAPAFILLLEKMAEKYESLGHFGGTFVLGNIAKEYRIQLGGFLGKDYQACENVSITYKQLQKALAESKFCSLDWKRIAETVLNKKMTSKKELKIREDEQREESFRQIIDNCKDDSVKNWLEDTADKNMLLRTLYRESFDELLQKIKAVDNAAGIIKELSVSQSNMLMPIFAAKATGDPHAFDEKRAELQLLLSFLEWKNGENSADTALSERDYNIRQLFRAGVIRDELSNNVLTYGFYAGMKDGKTHSGICSFTHQREPVNITLYTLGKIKKVMPQKGNNVYIVENPSIFSHLMNKYPEISLVCGNGQINMAVLTFLDMIPDKITMMYAGDYDPEGLLIAQKLKIRYGNRFKLWNYTPESYLENYSDKVLSDRRLKQLDSIVIPELKDIKECMLEKRCAAYQEKMIMCYKVGY